MIIDFMKKGKKRVIIIHEESIDGIPCLKHTFQTLINPMLSQESSYWKDEYQHEGAAVQEMLIYNWTMGDGKLVASSCVKFHS